MIIIQYNLISLAHWIIYSFPFLSLLKRCMMHITVCCYPKKKGYVYKYNCISTLWLIYSCYPGKLCWESIGYLSSLYISLGKIRFTGRLLCRKFVTVLSGADRSEPVNVSVRVSASGWEKGKRIILVAGKREGQSVPRQNVVTQKLFVVRLALAFLNGLAGFFFSLP